MYFLLRNLRPETFTNVVTWFHWRFYAHKGRVTVRSYFLQTPICVGASGSYIARYVIHRTDKYCLLVTLAFAVSLNTARLVGVTPAHTFYSKIELYPE